jgi:hypothetical protein
VGRQECGTQAHTGFCVRHVVLAKDRSIMAMTSLEGQRVGEGERQGTAGLLLR